MIWLGGDKLVERGGKTTQIKGISHKCEKSGLKRGSQVLKWQLWVSNLNPTTTEFNDIEMAQF